MGTFTMFQEKEKEKVENPDSQNASDLIDFEKYLHFDKIQTQLLLQLNEALVVELQKTIQEYPECLNAAISREESGYNGVTPLYIALDNYLKSRWDNPPAKKLENRKKIFLFLLEKGAHISLSSQDNLFQRMVNGELSKEKLKLLLDLLNDMFCSKRKAELLKFLIDKNYNKDINGNTLLHDICEYKSENDEQCLALMEYFFSLGLNVEINAQTRFSESCLHLSVKNKLLKTTEFLLKQKANTELMNQWGDTPLDSTYLQFDIFCRTPEDLSMYERDYLPFRELLLRFGAKTIAILPLKFPETPKATMEELSQEEKLKQDNALNLRLSPEVEKKLKEDHAALKEMIDKRNVLKLSYKTEAELKELKERHPNHFCFVVPLRNLRDPKSSYTVYFYQDFSMAEKKKINELQKDIKPIILKNRLGFELLHRKMGSLGQYLAKYPTITRKIGDTTLGFTDLTQADDYRFFVNTILTKAERLRELLSGDPKFFEFTPFLSACLLDKSTRAFAGGHQSNDLFPSYLALEVPTEAIEYLGPMDIGSPYGPNSTGPKIDYLKYTELTRMHMDWRQARYQVRILDNESEQYIPYSPYHAGYSLKQDPNYQEPRYKFLGSIPLYTADGLVKGCKKDPITQDSYCEAIIRGNEFLEKRKIRGGLLLVERSLLEKFIRKLPETDKEKSECIVESLKVLSDISRKTNGRIRLALIETDLLAFRKKHSVLSQLKMLEVEKVVLPIKWIKIATRLERFKMNNASVPQELQDEVKALKASIDNVPLEHATLVGLAQNPPLITARKKVTTKATEAINEALASTGLSIEHNAFSCILSYYFDHNHKMSLPSQSISKAGQCMVTEFTNKDSLDNSICKSGGAPAVFSNK